MRDAPILESLHERVLTITLNRPAARNAITPEMLPMLDGMLERAAASPHVGAIVLTGAGGAFCAGGDVKGMAAPDRPDERQARKTMLDSARTTLALHDMGKPTIAMLRGPAAGGGLALALACDLRLCDETARLTYAYTKIALPGDLAVNWLLVQVLGPARAREFAFRSPVVGAEEALELGLVHRVLPAGELEARTQALAAELANGSTAAIAEIKANLKAAVEEPRDVAVSREADSFIRCRAGADHREAALAFVEKRAPRFDRSRG